MTTQRFADELREKANSLQERAQAGDNHALGYATALNYVASQLDRRFPSGAVDDLAAAREDAEAWRRSAVAWQDWAAALLSELGRQPLYGQHGNEPAREIIGQLARMAPPVPRCTCGCFASLHEVDDEELRECTRCGCRQYVDAAKERAEALPGETPTKGAEPCQQPGESPGDSSRKVIRPGLLSGLADDLAEWANEAAPDKRKLTAEPVDPEDVPRLSDIELAALATLVNDETLRLKQRADAGETIDAATDASSALRDELRRRGVIGREVRDG